MHIVIILDHAYINGGQAKVALDSALGLRARGHQVTLFAAVGPVDPRLLEAGVDVICLNQADVHSAASKLNFAVQAFWNQSAAKALATCLANCPPDTIVHVHGWAKALSPSIGRAITASGLRSVYTMHEYFLVCPNGGFYIYPQERICQLRPMSADCISTNCDSRSYPRKIWRVARQAALNHASRLKEAARDIIAISQLQYDVVSPHMPPDTRWHRVDNPIAAEDCGPKEVHSSGEFLFVGRLSPEKGVSLFLEAARRVGIHARIVGDGPSGGELRSSYPEAEFLGWKNPQEVSELMRGARALVFPSIWYEGQPLTVYEALALGTPVIVSDACAGREAVTDGRTGRWFKSQSIEALADALNDLGDDETVSRMSTQAYQNYWSKPLTLERHLTRLEEVYLSVLLNQH